MTARLAGTVSGGALRRITAVCVIALVCAGSPVHAQRAVQPITGVVVDTTGAVLPNAQVDLQTPAGEKVESTLADASGNFRLDPVPPGRYQIVVSFEGFRPTTARVTVGGRPPSAVRVTLPLAAVQQEITVSNAPTEVATAAAANSDAVTVDQSMLDSLPIFDQDVVSTLSQFLDTGSIGTGGVSIVVNGMEVNSLNVSASAVQQIKINQDPYSAEYSRPGRGRIEILTKPGSQEFHGEGNLIFRDATLNARNAFAAVKPPEQRRIFEGFLAGPVGAARRTSFMVSTELDARDQESIVFALGPDGPIRDNVPQPNRHVLFSGTLTHQHSDKNTISIRPSYEDERNENIGVGGVALGSSARTFEHREAQATYRQQTVISPSLFNQFQVLLGSEREPTTSVSPAPAIVVQGAFTAGGAQADLLRTEHHIQAAESLTWVHGSHLVQTGFQLPDWSRRRFDDETNFGGTFYFASLQDYQANRPYSFTQQQGNGHVVLLEKVFGIYVKDDWKARPSLTLSLGVRYDWENYFHDNNNVAPRLSFAYAPGDGKRLVIRGGAGIFYDKTGPVPIADMLHFQPGGLERVVMTNPGYPDPFQNGGSLSSQPPSLVRFAPDIRIPYTVQYSAGAESQVRKGTTLALTYIGSRGRDLFRSRDVNAPPPPVYLSRPDPALGAVREIESAGTRDSDSLQATLRGKITKWFTGQMQYTLSRAYDDTGGLSWYPANDYDLTGEWARADFDRRHRFQMLGRLSPGFVDLGVGVNAQSGPPYTELLGADIFNNGRGRARPAGVPRNSLEAAGTFGLDLRVSREIALAKRAAGDHPAATIVFDAFNVTNRVNFVNYVGTVTSPLFGLPTGARSGRQLQLSLRMKF